MANPKDNSSLGNLKATKELINSLDFNFIVYKMVREQGWLRSCAIQACQLYKNLLFLQKKYGNQYNLVPSEEIDEVWHNHILDTKKYQEDCKLIFGELLHHYPYFGIDGNTTSEDLNKSFNITQELHYKEFGYYIYPVRHRLLFRALISFTIKFLRFFALMKLLCPKQYLNL